MKTWLARVILAAACPSCAASPGGVDVSAGAQAADAHPDSDAGAEVASVPVCPDLLDCTEECSDDAPIILCLLACADDGGASCSRCVVDGLVACVRPLCPTFTQDFRDCVGGCAADLMTCTKSTCKQATLRFEACAADAAAGGVCDAWLASCSGPEPMHEADAAP